MTIQFLRKEIESMETILGASETVTTLVTNVFDMITSNALLVVFVSAGLVGVGVGVFKKIKKAAR